MWITEHGHVLDFGMFPEGVLYLCREDILASPDDKVFCPVGKEDEALVILRRPGLQCRASRR